MGVDMIGDTKHSDILFKDWGITELSKDVTTPSLKELEEKIATGEELTSDMATKVRRSIARINYMAQDRPDLSAAAKALSQYMAKPREGTVPLVKRCVRYLKRHPRGALVVPRDRPENEMELETYTDSDWAGDIDTRRSTSGGVVLFRGAVLAHWSKVQSNIALSSGEAELNAAVKGLSETIGLLNLISETWGATPTARLCVDASACKGMVLRHGSGKVKHLSVKQLWVQEAVRAYGVQVSRVSRAENPADLLTHSVSHPTAEKQLQRINADRGRQGGEAVLVLGARGRERVSRAPLSSGEVK